jgi:SAM-dependent methyltransferase
MSDRAREHFDRISHRYERASKSWSAIYERVKAHLDPLIANQRVLDIGSGGVFPYDTALPSEITVLDISPNMLEAVDDPNVVTRVGDARNLEGIEDGSVDVMLFILSIHHINGDSAEESFATLDSILASARRALCQGGHLVVVEPVLPRRWFRLESLAFPLTRSLLARFGVPMIFFYSLEFLKERLARHFATDASAIQTERITMEDPIDPLGGSLPGLIRIPQWMNPFEYRLISLRVQTSDA